MCGEINITNVRKEDKELFRIVAELAPEKIDFIRGIAIGLQLQENEVAGLKMVRWREK